MSFDSLEFFLFFPLVVGLFWICPRYFRVPLLLAASCFFYMAFIPKYILILFALIGIDYAMARAIERSRGPSRWMCLMASIAATAGILFVFKYFNFFNQNLATLAHILHWNYSIGALQLMLPLGLSFHTFQSLSYVIEVYRGTYPAERNIAIYALYVMFFPQLIAGPIERPQHLLVQLQKIRSISLHPASFLSGLRLMAWGFFKKIVVSNRLAISVDYVWTHMQQLSGLSMVAACVFFAFEIYADFSGYSDIARGSARVLGVDIMRNFDHPYGARSISEFWRRWHISLMSWFRDYVYIPLGGNRFGRWRQYGNIFIVFLISGLWHGANWTFILWGTLHGSYMIIGRLTESTRSSIIGLFGLSRIPRVLNSVRVIFTFALVCIGWIIFRSSDLTTAIAFMERMLVGWNIPLSSFLDEYFINPFNALGFPQSDLLISAGSIVLVLVLEGFARKAAPAGIFDRWSLLARSFFYSGVVLAIIVFGVFSAKQFIYFQF